MSYYYYYHLLSSLFASNPNAARTPGDRFFFLSFALSFAAFNPQTTTTKLPSMSFKCFGNVFEETKCRWWWFAYSLPRDDDGTESCCSPNAVRLALCSCKNSSFVPPLSGWRECNNSRYDFSTSLDVMTLPSFLDLSSRFNILYARSLFIILSFFEKKTESSSSYRYCFYALNNNNNNRMAFFVLSGGCFPECNFLHFSTHTI